MNIDNFMNDEDQKAYEFLTKNSEKVADLTKEQIEEGAICFDLYRDDDNAIWAVMYTAPAGSLELCNEDYFDLMIKYDPLAV